MSELKSLYATIQDRKENPEQGSYTSYLFDKGLDKILKKLGEENTEVIIASLMQSKEDIINEIGEKRSKKSHNLKPERRPIENL